MLHSLWRDRSLVLELARRDFTGRYQGSFGGVVWSFVQPLFLLAVYTVAFAVILKARWSAGGGTGEYALRVFAGLIVFNAFAECLAKAPTLVVANPNFVKKVVFPLETLPWVMALSAIFHALIGICAWVLGFALVDGTPHATVLLSPLVLACFFPVLLGVGWSLAAVGVAVRDVGQLAAMVSHALLFLTPIFYGMEAVPPALQPLLFANPLTFIVEELRQVLLGHAPHFEGLAVYFAASSVFALASLALFRHMRPTFADLV